MKLKKLPSADYLKKYVRYNPETGILIWNDRPENPQWRARYSGKPAFVKYTDKGYLSGKINKEAYSAHRVIWKIMTGLDPIQIDHINGIRHDNRWCNLRNVTPSGNNHNRAIPSHNTSGVVGVYFHHNRWLSRIRVAGKEIRLGCFHTKEEAIKARYEAEEKYSVNHRRELVYPPRVNPSDKEFFKGLSNELA